MAKLIKDGLHYSLLIILIVYVLPWILNKLQIAQKLTVNIYYQWIITFIIYFVIFVFADKFLHKWLDLG